MFLGSWRDKLDAKAAWNSGHHVLHAARAQGFWSKLHTAILSVKELAVKGL